MIGKTYKLGLYWVEVLSVSAKSRRVRYRRLTRDGSAPIERMGAKAFERKARAG